MASAGARPPQGGVAAGLPRHLRDRAAQPGPADPLRAPQRARRRRRRADLLPVDRPRRRAAAEPACRCSASTPTGPAADFDVLAFNLSAELVYTNVLECIDLAGVPLHAARRGDADAARRRRRPLHLQPRAARRLRRRRRARRRRGGHRRDHRGAWRRGSGRASRPASASGCSATSPQVEGVYVPSLYDCTYDGAAPRRRHAPVRRRARAGREAHHRRPRRLALPEAASSCRSPRSCTTGSTSRCSAAAPAAAASARPG